MNKQRARIRGDESGFTLLEMVISIVISTMIIGAMAAVFVTSADSTNATKHRSNQTNDAQVIASFLVKDAQAAGSIDPQTASTDATVGVFTNGPSTCSVTGTALRLRWIDPSGVGSYVDAVYRLSGTTLTRTLCTTPISGGTTSSTVITLAKTVSSASPLCTTGGNPPGACNNGVNGANKIPDTVRLTITATTNPNASGTAIVGTYPYTLTANLRPSTFTYNGPPNGNATIPALLTLGTTCPAVNLDNNATVKIYGDAYINQDLSCVTQQNPSTLEYHTLTTSSGITNPYGSLQPPSSAGMPARSGCPGGVAQPGFYAANLTFANGVSCTFQSGIYIFEHGITFGNNDTLSTGPGGAVLYFPNEPLTASGNPPGNGTHITFAALQTGDYAGLAVWYGASGTITLPNVSSLIINGTLYAPNAVLQFSQTSSATSITSIVAAGVDFQNNAVANIGPQPKALAVGANVPSVWTLGAPFNPPVQATASGGFGTYIFGISGLSGLTIDSSTGLVSGAPTQKGNQTITITLDDSFGDTQAVANFPITINAGLNITTSSPLPDAKQGVAYSTPPLTATGGTGAHTWSATNLPAGFSIDTNTGVISGNSSITGASTAAVTVTDSVGATFTKSFSITVRPIIASVVLANKVGGIAGSVEQGDTITVTFSGPMSVATFCNTWSGNATDQHLNAGNLVTVSLNKGNPDTITITTSSGCTFNFGTISLASNAYTSSASRTFGGAVGNQSTIDYIAAQNQLVITLGLASGAVGTVASSTPTYTAAAAIRDGNNVALGNSPFALPTGQQF